MDTSAFFALIEQGDANFSAARAILREEAARATLLYTSAYVVAEAHALVLRRVGRSAGVRFLRSLEGPTFRIDRPTGTDETAARDIIYRYTDKDFSLTDAISFVVMERLGITTAFTFDRDFERYGFATAQP